MPDSFNKAKLIYLLCLLFSCTTPVTRTKTMQASITRIRTLNEISSASGIALKENAIYIVGDDSPWLFELNSAFKIVRKIQLFDTLTLENERIPKPVKPDYEAMTFLKWDEKEDLLLFGSGSTAARNILARVNIHEGSVKYYSLEPFYRHLRGQANISPEDFNIEGAAGWKENLLLLNRGTNTIFTINSKAFCEFMENGSAITIDLKLYELPALKGLAARFSGASVLPEDEGLLFCASVEDTPDWYSDGEVLGSYIGIINPGDPNNLTPEAAQVLHNGKPYIGKIESVVCIAVRDDSYALIAVTDNDDGTSSLLEVEMKK